MCPATNCTPITLTLNSLLAATLTPRWRQAGAGESDTEFVVVERGAGQLCAVQQQHRHGGVETRQQVRVLVHIKRLELDTQATEVTSCFFAEAAVLAGQQVELRHG